MKDLLKSQYLWGLFFLGLFLLNYPVLNIYNIPETWGGIPVLYIFIFSFWSLIIVLTYLVIKKTVQKNNVK